MSDAAWQPDPTGRHQYRYWDGNQWTNHVADNGVNGVDALSSTEAALPPEAGPTTPQLPSGMPVGRPGIGYGSEPPDPVTMLATRGQRIGAFFMEVLLAIVTLGIGYIVWSLVIWARGQTPGKQVLRMRVIRVENRRVANWGWMFLRQLGIYFALFFLIGIIVSLALDSSQDRSTVLSILQVVWWLANAIVFLIDSRNQTILDKIVKTVVIKEPNRPFYPNRR